MRFLFSSTGGLVYHLIAWRRAGTTWAPFRARVRVWLSDWREGLEQETPRDRVDGSASRDLIVFGPSAGWTLPLDLLVRFSRVLFVEPDPVARFLLRRRLPKDVRAEFISRADLLPWTARRPGVFSEFIAKHPGAAILFSNVLGQIPLIAKRPGTRMNSEFLSALEARAWASYHDLFSGSADGAELTASRDPAEVFKSGDVVDHETAWLSDKSSQLALWPLTENNLHIIEFVSCVESARARS